MSQRVSIHIATKDRWTELSNLLVSLQRQTFKNWDLILVDGSQPYPCLASKIVMDIIARIKREGHDVIFKQDLDNFGVCHARNIAIEIDKTENPLICRIDDDSICDDRYLELLVKTLEEHPDAGAVSGLVPDYAHEPVYRKSDSFETINKIQLNDDGSIKQFGDDAWAMYEPKVYQAHHLRSSFLFKRECLEKMKEKFGTAGFDTDLGQVGFREETSFCVKLLASGYKLYVNTEALCWHLSAPSGGTRRPDYTQQVQIADAHFRRKFSWWMKAGLLTKEMFN